MLTKSNVHVPIIFTCGHSDIPMSVRTIESGAIEFLAKPLHDQQVLDGV